MTGAQCIGIVATANTFLTKVQGDFGWLNPAKLGTVSFENVCNTIQQMAAATVDNGKNPVLGVIGIDINNCKGFLYGLMAERIPLEYMAKLWKLGSREGFEFKPQKTKSPASLPSVEELDAALKTGEDLGKFNELCNYLMYNGQRMSIVITGMRTDSPGQAPGNNPSETIGAYLKWHEAMEYLDNPQNPSKV